MRPDAFVAVGVGNYIWSWFCEVDRGSESVPVILRKCHLLTDYRQTGIEQTKHGGTFPRVCWLVPDELRAERLRRAIAADRHLPERLFTVATSEQAVAVLCGGTPSTEAYRVTRSLWGMPASVWQSCPPGRWTA